MRSNPAAGPSTATSPEFDMVIVGANEVAEHTLYSSCNSWYLGANVPGKTRVFMPARGLSRLPGCLCRDRW